MQHKFIDIGCHSGPYMAVSMSASLSVYTAYNDSHRNARKHHIDLQAPENTSHFAMRITLFSSLINTVLLAYNFFHQFLKMTDVNCKVSGEKFEND